jgi:hypothetical protein
MQHRAVIGDVRLTRVDVSGSRRTTCAVRRRDERTPAQVAQLHEDVSAAIEVLRKELGRRRIVFQDNYAVPGFVEVAVGRPFSVAATVGRMER